MVELLKLSQKDLDKALQEISVAYPNKPVWSEREIYIMKKLSGSVSDAKIAKLIKRTYPQVHWYLYKLRQKGDK